MLEVSRVGMFFPLEVRDILFELLRSDWAVVVVVVAEVEVAAVDEEGRVRLLDTLRGRSEQHVIPRTEPAPQSQKNLLKRE